MRYVIVPALLIALLAFACDDDGGEPRATAPSTVEIQTRIATPEPPPTPSPASPPSRSLVLYSSQVLKVELRYPADWVPDANYSNSYREPGGREYGFFGVNALNADGMTLDKIANAEVRHKFKPYGENPRIVSLTVDGREARLILPDEASPAPESFVADLIVPYSSPVLIASSPNGYEFLVIHSHKDFIQSIAGTVRLLD